MSLQIKLKLISPEKVVLEKEIFQATLPVANGEITILPNHRSYIGTLKAGEITLKNGKEDYYLAVAGGFVEFDRNNMTILVDSAEYAHEINLERAEEAKKRAEEVMKQKHTMDEVEYAKVAAAIEREMARIRVARKHHTKRNINLEQ